MTQMVLETRLLIAGLVLAALLAVGATFWRLSNEQEKLPQPISSGAVQLLTYVSERMLEDCRATIEAWSSEDPRQHSAAPDMTSATMAFVPRSPFMGRRNFTTLDLRLRFGGLEAQRRAQDAILIFLHSGKGALFWPEARQLLTEVMDGVNPGEIDIVGQEFVAIIESYKRSSVSRCKWNIEMQEMMANGTRRAP